MNLGQRLLLLTSLGQLKQLRLWLPEFSLPLPPDLGIRVIRKDDGDVLNLMNLEKDLYSRLVKFVEFLNNARILDEPMITFEADFDSNIIFSDRTIIFSVMMSSQGQLLLTYTSGGNHKELEEILAEEWESRLNIFSD